MKIGIIGSGVVAQTLGAKLIELGHDVVLGTRDPAKLDEKKNMAGTLREWIASDRTRRARSPASRKRPPTASCCSTRRTGRHRSRP